MQQGLLAAHSGWRWIAFIALIVAIGYGAYGLAGKTRWNETSRKIAVFTTIALDIQLLLGLVLYIVGQYWTSLQAGPKMAHPTMMILALVSTHVMSARIKRGSGDKPRFRTLLIGAVVTLVLVLLGIAALGSAARIYTMS